MSRQRDYDSTVARIAGNILSGTIGNVLARLLPSEQQRAAANAVALAREIVAEVRRTEPREES